MICGTPSCLALLTTPESPTTTFGPQLSTNGTAFRLWAPGAGDISLEVEGAAVQALAAGAEGMRGTQVGCGAGARYAFRLENGLRVPDPASHAQEESVFGPSVVVDPDGYAWRCNDWRGRPWEETILYELHVGLLGGFDGVVKRLEKIAALGFTAVELMPVADFPGGRNWGYDGVLPFAPARAYGSPEDLKRLVDRAHALGLMVFLDVVYNHFGPDGNFIAQYAPEFFRNDRHTPWGAAIDFREPMVRRFFIENAIYWICEYRLDGLRFDAVQAIGDNGLLVELAARVRTQVAPGRHVHLVLENDDNDARLLAQGFDAQWNDDLHHALHVLLTGETAGYYGDYATNPAHALARALGEGFVYQGEPSTHRDGKPRGTPSADLAPTAFISFLQNHDQIGNRAFGERLTTLADPDALRAAIALLLLAPQVPLVFMGEEAGVREPFLYFTDHKPELGKSVREGRRAEFAKFAEFADPKRRGEIPDPNAPATFEASRPRLDGKGTQEWNAFYARLLHLRHERIIPRLRGTCALGAAAIGTAAVLARWRLNDGAELVIAANFGAESALAELPAGAPIWGPRGTTVPPRSTLAWICE